VRAACVATVTVVALVALPAGRGAAATEAGPSLAARSIQARQVSSPKVPLTKPSRKTVGFAVVGGPNLVLVTVGSQAGGSQLLAATAAGTDVRNIGPRIPADEYPESVFFLDETHGWFATFSAVRNEMLYRTDDAGRTWQASPAPDHVIATATTDVVQSVTPDVGWLADIEPTGPTETLYHTADGGASWQPVAVLNQGLPRLGVVEFEPGGAVGWLGGVPYYPGPLEFTTDSGRDWQPVALPESKVSTIVGVPAIFGATLIEPVVNCSAGVTELRTYLSPDNGAQWSLTSAAAIALGCQQVATAFPSQSVGWAAALSRGRVVVERTTDQGRHWTTIATPQLTTSYPPYIVAPGAGDAWLLVQGPGGTRVYVTADAGKTWRRIDQNLTR
jgi:photosystem II stability/assembly factor-like uncharacterized protein